MPRSTCLFSDFSPLPKRSCDWAGCDGCGDFKAPKSRKRLRDYYWFCLDHIRLYNANWDYLAGLSESEIEASIREATVWERPTWKTAALRESEAKLRESIFRTFRQGANTNTHKKAAFSEEDQALRLLGLAQPVTFADIKERYRALAKKHHPDANGGSDEALERIKTINRAFAVLRSLYEGQTAQDETPSEGN